MVKEKKMEKELKLSDEVWHRVVQIIQEAMLEGVDCADLLRMVRVVEGPGEELVLSLGYKKSVKEMHEKLLAKAEELKSETQSATSKLLFD